MTVGAPTRVRSAATSRGGHLNLRIDLAYDGTPFRGFARQADVPSVQATLEDALGRLLQQEVTTTGAGRTDAGVHALAGAGRDRPDAPTAPTSRGSPVP